MLRDVASGDATATASTSASFFEGALGAASRLFGIGGGGRRKHYGKGLSGGQLAQLKGIHLPGIKGGWAPVR